MQRSAVKQQNQPRSLQGKKLTGIAPVFDAAYPLDGFKIIDAKSASFSLTPPPSDFAGPIQRGGILGTLSEITWIRNFLNNWVFQEFWFVMNKLSLFGLMMGMMFLGAVFFGVGFLTAYKTLPDEANDSKNAWHHANAGQSAASTQLAQFAGSYAQDVALGAAGKAMNIVGKATDKLPPSLKPFSNYASSKLSQKMMGGAGAATELAKQNTQKIMSGHGGVGGNPYNAPGQSQDQSSGQMGEQGRFQQGGQGAYVPQAYPTAQQQYQPQAYPQQQQQPQVYGPQAQQPYYTQQPQMQYAQQPAYVPPYQQPQYMQPQYVPQPQEYYQQPQGYYPPSR